MPAPERRNGDGAEHRAVTPVPGTVGVNLDPIRPAVFATSIASRLGIDMPRVAGGTYATATITTSQTAAAKQKAPHADAAAVATAGALTVTTATPKRVSARLELTPQVDEEGDITPLDAFRADLAKAKGGTLVMEHSGQWESDAAPGAGRQSRLEHQSYGMDRATVDPLRTATGRDVLAACGVPPTLFVANSDGTSQRESFRRFLHSSLRPVARIMEAELCAKLDAPDLVLDLSELHAADALVRCVRQGRGASRRCRARDGCHPDPSSRGPIACMIPGSPRKFPPFRWVRLWGNQVVKSRICLYISISVTGSSLTAGTIPADHGVQSFPSRRDAPCWRGGLPGLRSLPPLRQARA